VLLDLIGRNLVTSSEMAQLLVWQQELAAAGTEMMLVGLTDAVRVILSILRMDSCIPCCSNIDAAIGMWQKSA
nr:hypothetical protein [Planctomycetota bacterium]